MSKFSKKKKKKKQKLQQQYFAFDYYAYKNKYHIKHMYVNLHTCTIAYILHIHSNICMYVHTFVHSFICSLSYGY